MAIWQQGLSIVPAIWDILPTPDKDSSREYENAWRKIKIKHLPIIKQIDSFIPRADWVNSKDYFCWKGDTENNDDNDIWMSVDEKLGIIISLSFRFDLRSESTFFLEKMFGLVDKNEWKLKTYGGKIFDANLSFIPKIVKESSWHEFLADPDAYLKKIEDLGWD